MISDEEAEKKYQELVEERIQPKSTLKIPEPSFGRRVKPKPTLDQYDSFEE
jgi:hypothetical protein